MTSRDESGSSRLPGAGTVELRSPLTDVPSDESTRAEARVAAAWERLLRSLQGRRVPSLVIAIGLGRGELLAALDRHAPATRVLALEPNPARARAFLTRDEWRGWRESARLTYLTGPDFAGASEAARIFPDNVDDHIVLVDPAVAAAAGPEAMQAVRTLKTLVFGARANAEARRQFAPRYLTNSLRNLPSIVSGRDVRSLAGAYAGVPALIVAAGPSLDRALDEVRDTSSRALTIAVDTALRPLLTADISPHLVVGLDPSALNARHFRGLVDCPDTWLVSESALDSSASRHFGDRTFWFRVANHEPWPWYRELGVDVGTIEVWGSVITAAFQVALLAGCDPIVFVGADLSYTDGRPYCRGTTYEFDWAVGAAEGVDLETIWRACTAQGELVTGPDLRGASAVSTAALTAFRDWLAAHAARSGRRVINATGAGMFFGAGIEQMALTNALPSRRDIAPVSAAGAARPGAIRPYDLAAQFRKISSRLTSRTPDPVVDRWTAFCGGTLDVVAAVAALDHGAIALEAARAATASTPASPTVVGRLPEAIQRWRGVLRRDESVSGTPSTSVGNAEDSLDLLVDASHVLQRIGDALRREPEDLALVSGAGDRPARASYDWPDEIGWDVTEVEAMLGLASNVRQEQSTDSFFTRAVDPREPLASDRSSLQALDRPHAARASAWLTLQWASTVLARDPSDSADRRRVRALVAEALTRVQPSTEHARDQADASLLLTTRQGDEPRSIEFSLEVSAAGLARFETGVISGATRTLDEPGWEETLAQLASNGRSASVVLRRGRRPGAAQSHRRVNPRVLTDEGVPLAHIAYADPSGAVCVAPFSNGSFIVCADGSTSTGQQWPRPILSELPIGPFGVAAWSNGLGRGAAKGSPYVMLRRPDGSIEIVDDLPFRPGRGAWFRDRLYWTCSLWGIASWTPEGGTTHALHEHSFIEVGVRDDELLLSPCVRSASGARLRRRAERAWRWDGTRDPQPVELGPSGAETSRVRSAHGWIATAFPEADLLTLESPEGVVSHLTCYFPYQLAWLDGSLLVSTLAGELLLFEHLIDHLAGEGR
jgi:hypothetical protein